MKILQFQASQMGFDEASFDQLKSRCQQLLFQKQQMVEMGMDLQKIEEFQQQQQYAQTEEQANQLKSMGVPLCTIQQYQQQQQTLICQVFFNDNYCWSPLFLMPSLNKFFQLNRNSMG